MDGGEVQRTFPPFATVTTDAATAAAVADDDGPIHVHLDPPATAAPTDTTADRLHGPVDAHRLRQLLDAVMVIGSDLDLSAVLQRIVETATALVGARYGALGVLDESHEALSDFIHVGIDESTAEAIGELPHGRGVLGDLINDPRPLRLDDLRTHPDSTGFPPNHPPMTSMLGAPVLVRGQAFGNLYLCDKTDGEPFTADDEELVVTLAGAAGVAIDNARLHARVADITLMEDRDRIARDLHDTVIQRLFAVGLSLESAARASTDERAATRMQAAVDDLDVTIKEIRTSIFELHSGRGSAPSLRQAAIDLAAESTRTLGYEPSIRFDGPIDTLVSDVVATHVLAVMREALANVARHSGARTVEVHLTAHPGEVRLDVLDDGIGFDHLPDPAGHGISNMSARATELGGRFALGARSGGGTELHWSAPL